ncbi:MAG: TetR/AcrR family transcriptional regulator [Actinomycetaceae bacterium]|nr:TetR/AcrR family transcriptional regulator [Actinomycetaceae bacterium]
MSQWGEGVRQRRTGAVLLDDIATAVMAELGEHGYGGVTFEGVARRAKTSKTVLYRRFSTRADMVISSALRSANPAVREIPLDQGLAPGLHAAARVLAERLSIVGLANVNALIGEADEQARAMFATVSVHPGLRFIQQLYEAEVVAGRLDKKVLEEVYIRFPLVYVIGEILTRGTVDEAAIGRMIDAVIVPFLENLR